MSVRIRGLVKSLPFRSLLFRSLPFRSLIAVVGAIAGILSSANSAASECHPLRVNTCALPFPSNFYSVEDSTSPTGRRISISNDVVSAEIVNQIPAQALPAATLNGLTGYSALTPVLFELESPIKSSTLPASGGEALKVFNRATGQLMPLVADLFYPAQSIGITNKATVVEAYPRSRWTFGETYIAVLTKQLKKKDSSDYLPSQGVVDAVSQAVNPLALQFKAELEFLASKGIKRQDILSFTQFTVRNEASVTGKLLDIVDTVQQQNHGMTITSAVYLPVGPIAARVTGRVELTDFRDSDSAITYQHGEQGKSFWTSYNLTLPRAALTGSAPLMLYGHGIVWEKTSAIIIEVQNAMHGVATITIDHPYHGTRIATEGYIASHFKPEDVMHIIALGIQSTIDFHSLLTAIKQNLNDLDLLPGKSLLFASDAFHAGLNTPDLDLDNITYGGISLGGLLGTAFAATAADIKGAFLEVAGGGIGNTLTHTGFYDVLRMDKMFPEETKGGELSFLLSAAIHLVDYADGLNFAHYFQHPPADTGLLPKALTLQFGFRDHIVPNSASVALAEAAGLPVIVSNGLPALGFLDAQPVQFDGNGVFQSPARIPAFFAINPNTLTDMVSHTSFFDNVTTQAHKAFVDTVIHGIPPGEITDDDIANDTQPPCVNCAVVDPEPPTTVETVQPTNSDVSTPVTSPSPTATTAPRVVNQSSGGVFNWWSFILMLLFVMGKKLRWVIS